MLRYSHKAHSSGKMRKIAAGLAGKAIVAYVLDCVAKWPSWRFPGSSPRVQSVPSAKG